MDELLELQEWVKEHLEKLIKEEKNTAELYSEGLIWDKILKKIDEMILNY